MINMIVAMDKNYGIGKQGKSSWYIPEELKIFRKYTYGHPVIMGRTTWESLPKKPLTGRTNIIITHHIDKNFPEKNICYCDCPSQALDIAKSLDETVYIIGGAKIYETYLKMNVVDRLLVSHIPKSYDCDVFFPCLNPLIKWPKKLIKQYNDFELWEYSNHDKRKN